MEKPTLALALEQEAGEKEEPVLNEQSDPGLVEAAGAVRAAMKGGDDAEFAKTLEGFIKLCGEYQ